jgi:restriction system protein
MENGFDSRQPRKLKMLIQDIENILQVVPEISKSANYWFVRTEGGSFYNAFIESNSIALGYGKIGVNQITALSSQNRSKGLQRLVKINYPDNKRPGLAASQILRFFRDIRKNDYVIIPSSESKEIYIGQVMDNEIFEQPIRIENETFEEYSKRRNVQWLKRVKRSRLNPNLLGILYTHQTISKVNNYAPWIDPVLFDFFRKGEDFHYVISIKRKNQIHARVLFKACSDLLDVADQFSILHNFKEETSDIETRINLNSPGTVELIGRAARFMFVIAAIVVFLNGGGVSLKVDSLGLDLNLETNGLIHSLSDFLNNQADQNIKKALADRIQELNIDDPEVISQIIKAIGEHKDD